MYFVFLSVCYLYNMTTMDNKKNQKKNYKSGNHCKYNVSYHIIWIPKYRRSVLVGDIETRLKEILIEKAAQLEIEIGAMECMPDHIHIFIKATPQMMISTIVKHLKGYSSYVLRKEFVELKQCKVLWAPSYFVETIGHISEKTVRKYIEDQKTKG